MIFIVVSMASPSITDGSGDDDSDERVFFWGKVVLTLFKGRTSTSTLFLNCLADRLKDKAIEDDFDEYHWMEDSAAFLKDA